MENIESEKRITPTMKVMLRIAELKIKAHKLKDTPKGYVKKCQEKRI